MMTQACGDTQGYQRPIIMQSTTTPRFICQSLQSLIRRGPGHACLSDLCTHLLHIHEDMDGSPVSRAAPDEQYRSTFNPLAAGLASTLLSIHSVWLQSLIKPACLSTSTGHLTKSSISHKLLPPSFWSFFSNAEQKRINHFLYQDNTTGVHLSCVSWSYFVFWNMPNTPA